MHVSWGCCTTTGHIKETAWSPPKTLQSFSKQLHKSFRTTARLDSPRTIGDRKGTTKKLCDKDILPNVRVNFLVQFASKSSFYWVMAHNLLELFRKVFGDIRATFWLCGSF